MHLIGLMPCRNEDWVLGLSARAALMWCDELLVLNHASTDRTEEILAQVSVEHQGRLCWINEPSAVWAEMDHRQRLLNLGRVHEGTHFALVDADEVLTGNLLDSIRGMVQGLAAGAILMLPWLCLRPEGVMVSGMWAGQNASTAFMDNPAFHWAARDGYDLHHRHPMGMPYDLRPVLSNRSGGLMHLQFLSRRRLLAKQYLYQLVEQKRWPGRRMAFEVREYYARTVRESESALVAPLSDSWCEPYRHLLQFLHVDAEPWQEAECKRLLSENPGLGAGLDDFGLVKEWAYEHVRR